MLSPFVVDHGWDDAVAGELYDTGFGYPGATFAGSNGPADTPDDGSLVIGRTVQLLEHSLGRALEVLDHEEDIVEGLYRRVLVTTRAGALAWAYEWATHPTGPTAGAGGGPDLARIPSGDWCRR